ncbi:MAG: acetyl-CoA carboxylase biotin carboxyl carrier protein subunit [Crocinitomicaceae bacterium]|nr:acetyl-CoA carboxylase biotin carboxyl carrier protein subunit [Crocinitomicaceae bacterium]
MEWEVRWPGGRVERVSPQRGEAWDWKPIGPGVYDVRMGIKNVRIETLEGPDVDGHVRIRVNGVEHQLQVLDDQKMLLESMGMNTDAEAEGSAIEAPMPGKVLEVKVAAGDEVAAGDAVLVLEAMKMENVLRAPREGKIEQVHTRVGEAVEKGAVLVTYEMN